MIVSCEVTFYYCCKRDIQLIPHLIMYGNLLARSLWISLSVDTGVLGHATGIRTWPLLVITWIQLRRLLPSLWLIKSLHT